MDHRCVLNILFPVPYSQSNLENSASQSIAEGLDPVLTISKIFLSQWELVIHSTQAVATSMRLV